MCLAENNITGTALKTLTDGDLKDLIPVFLMRKRLRDWIRNVVGISLKLDVTIVKLKANLSQLNASYMCIRIA